MSEIYNEYRNGISRRMFLFGTDSEDSKDAFTGLVAKLIVIGGVAAAASVINCRINIDPARIDFLQQNIDNMDPVLIRLRGGLADVLHGLDPFEAIVEESDYEDGKMYHKTKIMLPPSFLETFVDYKNPEFYIRDSNKKILASVKHYIGKAGEYSFLAPGGDNSLIVAETVDDPIVNGGLFHYGSGSFFDFIVTEIKLESDFMYSPKGVRFLVQGK